MINHKIQNDRQKLRHTEKQELSETREHFKNYDENNVLCCCYYKIAMSKVKRFQLTSLSSEEKQYLAGCIKQLGGILIDLQVYMRFLV